MADFEIEGYDIDKQLTSQGMMEVYQAHDVDEDRTVVVKMIKKPWSEDEEFVSDLLREARALARLKHPNLMEVYEVGEHEETGRPFIVMQYAEGGTVRDRLGEGPIEPALALRMLREATEALQHAHTEWIMHLSIRPEDLFLDSNAKVMIGDFSVAHGGEVDLERSEEIYGAATYMGPEQWDNDEADEQSDIWALGVTFYEMLTGQKPYSGDTPAEIRQSIDAGPFKPAHEMRPSVPENYDDLLNSMLAVDPEDRYQFCEDLLEDIENLGAADEDEEEPEEEPAPEPEPEPAAAGAGAAGTASTSASTGTAAADGADASLMDKMSETTFMAGAGVVALLLLVGVYFGFLRGGPGDSDGTVGGGQNRAEYPLVVQADPDTAGEVDRSPARDKFHYGDTVTLRVRSIDGWRFAGWSDGPTGTERTYRMGSETTTLTARFEPRPPDRVGLRVFTEPAAGGRVVKRPDQEEFNEGSTVRLTAQPNDGWRFAGWQDGVQGQNRTLTLNESRSLVARFQRIRYAFAVDVEPSGAGSVSLDPSRRSYAPGTSIRLRARPADGWVFAGWSDGPSGASRNYRMPDRSARLEARFRRERHTLSVEARPSAGGRVFRNPDDERVPAGTTVRLTARASDGWRFAGWEDGTTGENRSVTVNADRTVTALFEEIRYARVDGFEEGDFRDRWPTINQELDASAEASGDEVREGSRSLHLQVGPTGSGAFSMQNRFDASDLRDGDEFSAWIYLTRTPVNINYALGSANNSSVAILNFDRSGNILYGTERAGEDNVLVRGYSSETWYRLTMRVYPDRQQVEFTVTGADGSSWSETAPSSAKFERVAVQAQDYPGNYSVYLDDVTYAAPSPGR